MLKRFWFSVAQHIWFKRSFGWGIGVVAFVLLVYRLVLPFVETLRDWWDELFREAGIERFFVPGIEIPLTVLGILVIGRFAIVMKDAVKRFMKHSQGIPVIYERYDGLFFPGFVRAIIPVQGSSFPHPYLLKILPSLRGMPDFGLLAPNRAWVSTKISGEVFAVFFATSSAVAPDTLEGLIPWEEWSAQHPDELP